MIPSYMAPARHLLGDTPTIDVLLRRSQGPVRAVLRGCARPTRHRPALTTRAASAAGLSARRRRRVHQDVRGAKPSFRLKRDSIAHIGVLPGSSSRFGIRGSKAATGLAARAA